MLFTERATNFVKRTFQKFQEWIISAQLERQYTKDEIIAMYLNRFDWINQAVGINSAARVYFNTTPDSLNDRRSRIARGHVQEPSAVQSIAPTGYHHDRRMVVLDQMRKNGYLTTAEYDSLKVASHGAPLSADRPYRRTCTVFPRSAACEIAGAAWLPKMMTATAIS